MYIFFIFFLKFFIFLKIFFVFLQRYILVTGQNVRLGC